MQHIIEALKTTGKYYEAVEGLKDANYIKYHIDYEMGGRNYFNGQVNSRGYYLYARAVNRENRGGYFSESFALFGNGGKWFLHDKPLARKSDKAKAEALNRLTAELLETMTNIAKGNK